MQFAEILSKLMQEKEVTAYRIGKDTGISNRLITYWKDGEKMPGAENLKRLADYFCVSTDYLLGKEQKEKAPTPEDEREIDDETLKAAFWGGEKDLSSEELDALWEDVREYARYKAEQRRKKKHE